MSTNEQNILKYCYWLDDQTLAMLKKKMATVEKARVAVETQLETVDLTC